MINIYNYDITVLKENPNKYLIDMLYTNNYG